MTSSNLSAKEEDIKIIRQVYAGINRNDIDFVLTLMDPNIVRIEPDGFPTSGTYRGLYDLRKHLNTGRSTWEEGGCEPVDFFVGEDKIVVIVHVKVRLKNNPEWIDAQIADGFVIKEGLVAEFYSYTNNEKAFEWAGIPRY